MSEFNDASNNTSTKKRLSDKVFDYVVENIRCGKFKPGVKLTEREICEKLCVSHIPVREAIERLHRESWIERFPHRGSFVKQFDSNNNINELCQIREIIENACIHTVAKNITREQLDELKKVTDQIEYACETKNPDLYEQADAQFHVLLVHFLGNKRLDEIFQGIIFQRPNFLYTSAIQAAFDLGKGLENNDGENTHKKIYQALAENKVEETEKILKSHMKQGRKLMLIMNKAHEVLKVDTDE